MRSLTPTGLTFLQRSKHSPELRITKVAVDPESNVVYAILEKRDEGVQVEVVKYETFEDGSVTQEVSCLFLAEVRTVAD
jgi:hypothetical protein